jgi:hypothetical protein
MDAVQQIVEFISFEARFKQSPEWAAMVRTVEDSPWHREANVAVHTEMLLDVLWRDVAKALSPRDCTLTGIACLFHDVGKPPAEVIKFKEDRGEYRAYHGHEQLSARMWVDYALRHKDDLAALELDVMDVSHIAFMIEHHVPFQLKDERKRKALKLSMIERGVHDAWLSLLWCDQHGRTSDDQEQKLAAVNAWLKEWRTL